VQQTAGPDDLLVSTRASEQLVDHAIADQALAGHPHSLADPAAATSAIDGLLDQPRRKRCRVEPRFRSSSVVAGMNERGRHAYDYSNQDAEG
jgi:hypothetical protein